MLFPSALNRNGPLFSPTLVSIALLSIGAATTIGTPPAHSLLINAISWTILWALAYVKSYTTASSGNSSRRRHCWAAGGLLALAQICHRGSGSKDELWWTTAFLPLAVYVTRFLDAGSLSSSTLDPAADHHKIFLGSKRLLAILTIASFIALAKDYVPPQSVALGLCALVMNTQAYITLEDILNKQDQRYAGDGGGFVSANGSISRYESSADLAENNFVTCLKDVALVMALSTAVGSFCMESFRSDTLIFRKEYTSLSGEHWKAGQQRVAFVLGLIMMALSCVRGILMLMVVKSHGAASVAFIELGATVLARLFSSVAPLRSWFALLSAIASYLFLYERSSPVLAAFGRMRRMRLNQIFSAVAALSFMMLAVSILRQSLSSPISVLRPSISITPTKPLLTNDIHPMDYLITQSEADFKDVLSKQSKSLSEAVAEYRRRYQIPPPPNFDKWYEFAKNRGVQLIDEYDNIYHSLLPFWSLDPSTIRARAREALGFDNSLIAMLIRDGEAAMVENGPDWQQEATLGMIQDFVQYLPDMDLAFNIHDEPRVVVPHEDLTRMVAFAKDKVLPMAFFNEAPRNAFSPRPRDVNNGKRIEEVKTTRFNKFAHQPTWTHSRLSCPPDSPARALGEYPVDNATSYALGELGFVYNQTAFCDICTSPSFREMYGFFDRPNAFNIVHDLFPIFSQSKISSFQDILYPSPWYWFGKVAYEEEKDFDWSKKKNQLYWRGSTTGGFSRDGGWRRQHRQHLVKRINAADEGKIIENAGGQSLPNWRMKEVKREDYKDIFNVKFSHVGQCDPGDCDAQREFFEIVEPESQQEAWASKYLLDVDGNAFSGRFYAFLMSKSLVYKLAVFKEWHEHWLKPWVHYIPLGLTGDEWLESVRYFAQEPSGQAQAERLAMQGREWASKALRNEDFEVWFFRLLLEYGRIIDDDRHLIGYSAP